jgi:predicted lipid-binding transport protein (Tim44 family)
VAVSPVHAALAGSATENSVVDAPDPSGTRDVSVMVAVPARVEAPAGADDAPRYSDHAPAATSATAHERSAARVRARFLARLHSALVVIVPSVSS